MPSVTITKFFCDTCEKELPTIKSGVSITNDCKVTFKFFADGEWHPDVNEKFDMMCKDCKSDLIQLISDFKLEKHPRR